MPGECILWNIGRQTDIKCGAVKNKYLKEGSFPDHIVQAGRNPESCPGTGCRGLTGRCFTRQAKFYQEPPVCRNFDVPRFDIAVDDWWLAGMQVLQGLANSGSGSKKLIFRDWPT